MKLLIIILFLFTNLFSNELLWVNEQINAIKPARVGIKDSELSLVKNPIIFLNTKVTKSTKKSIEKRVFKSKIKKNTRTYKQRKRIQKNSKNNFKYKFQLEAIMNSSAMISGKWYSLGNKVKGYKIVEINNNSVILIRNRKSIILSTSTKNRTIKFKNR